LVDIVLVDIVGDAVINILILVFMLVIEETDNLIRGRGEGTGAYDLRRTQRDLVVAHELLYEVKVLLSLCLDTR
jgi:hypothetical protein